MNDFLKSVAPTVASALQTHSLFWRLTFGKSVTNNPTTYSGYPNPLGKGFSRPIARYTLVIPFVISLLLVCSPTAVFGGVIPVDIDSIERHVFRLDAHISEEILETTPSIANSYTPATVYRVFDFLTIRASLNHRPPCEIRWGVRHPVGNVCCFSRFCLEAPTRFSMPLAKAGCANGNGITAVAVAHPLRFRHTHSSTNMLFSDKPSESFPSNIYGAIIKVSSAPARYRVPRLEVYRTNNCFVSASTLTFPSGATSNRLGSIKYNQISKYLSGQRYEFRHISSYGYIGIIDNVEGVWGIS